MYSPVSALVPVHDHTADVAAVTEAGIDALLTTIAPLSPATIITCSISNRAATPVGGCDPRLVIYGELSCSRGNETCWIARLP